MSSVEEDITALLQNASGILGRPPAAAVADAVKETNALFLAMNDSFVTICGEIAGAVSQSALRVAFSRPDKVMRIFFEVAPGRVHRKLIHDALSSFKLSARLTSFMISTDDPRDALKNYKRTVIQSLAAAVMRKKDQALVD